MPERVLVPAVMLTGMLTCHAFDAGYIVFVPLAGLIFAAAGRHPVLGLTVGFAGVCVGLAGNLLPGQYDVLVLSITETGARLIEPGWTMNPVGNWWFSIGDRRCVHRAGLDRHGAHGRAATRPLARRRPGREPNGTPPQLTPAERRGLRAAGLAALGVVALFAALSLYPGFTPLYDEAAAPGQRLTPLFRA